MAEAKKQKAESSKQKPGGRGTGEKGKEKRIAKATGSRQTQKSENRRCKVEGGEWKGEGKKRGARGPDWVKPGHEFQKIGFVGAFD